MAPGVNVVFIHLKPGICATDSNTTGGQVWNDTLHTIHVQEGCERVFWGAREEEPDMLDVVVIWRDIQDHKNFMAKPIYTTFSDNLTSILASPVKPFQIETPSIPALSVVLSAPTTEVKIFYLPLETERTVFEPAFSRYTSKVQGKADGFVGSLGSWGIKEVEHPAFSTDGGTGKQFLGLLGWEFLGDRREDELVVAVKEKGSSLGAIASHVETHYVKFGPH